VEGVKKKTFNERRLQKGNIIEVKTAEKKIITGRETTERDYYGEPSIGGEIFIEFKVKVWDLPEKQISLEGQIEKRFQAVPPTGGLRQSEEKSFLK